MDLDTGRCWWSWSRDARRLGADWLEALDADVRRGIAEVTMDPFAGYYVGFREPVPDDGIVVVRGGPTTLAKPTEHARRTHDAFLHDGQPLWGLSVFCALDDIGHRAAGDGRDGVQDH